MRQQRVMGNVEFRKDPSSISAVVGYMGGVIYQPKWDLCNGSII